MAIAGAVTKPVKQLTVMDIYPRDLAAKPAGVSFDASGVPDGNYRLWAQALTFQTARSTVAIGKARRQDFTLQVGAVNQEVQVSANAAMVETQDTSLSEVIDQRRIVGRQRHAVLRARSAGA